MPPGRCLDRCPGWIDRHQKRRLAVHTGGLAPCCHRVSIRPNERELPFPDDLAVAVLGLPQSGTRS
jgi:hypothetical protein